MRRWIVEKGNYEPAPTDEEIEDFELWRASRIMGINDLELAAHTMRDALVQRALYYDTLEKELAAGVKITQGEITKD